MAVGINEAMRLLTETQPRWRHRPACCAGPKADSAWVVEQRPGIKSSSDFSQSIVDKFRNATYEVEPTDSNRGPAIAYLSSNAIRSSRCSVVGVPHTRGKKVPPFLPITSLLNPRSAVKRRRSKLDVDGPNTAGLSSKKRRLQTGLVTSRLSRPYSQPASFICGRKGTTASSRRLAKMESSADLEAKRAAPSWHDGSYLRLSMLNRMRNRLALRDSAASVEERDDAGFGDSYSKAQSGWGPPWPALPSKGTFSASPAWPRSPCGQIAGDQRAPPPSYAPTSPELGQRRRLYNLYRESSLSFPNPGRKAISAVCPPLERWRCDAGLFCPGLPCGLGAR